MLKIPGIFPRGKNFPGFSRFSGFSGFSGISGDFRDTSSFSRNSGFREKLFSSEKVPGKFRTKFPENFPKFPKISKNCTSFYSRWILGPIFKNGNLKKPKNENSTPFTAGKNRKCTFLFFEKDPPKGLFQHKTAELT